MDTVVVGAGPSGLVCAVGLARRGHRVRLVDRDAGPTSDGSWARRGVMQFHHPHGFRQQAVDVLLAEMPEAVEALRARGVEPIAIPTGPDTPPRLAGLRCRRSVFEEELRGVAVREPGVTWVTAHADGVLADHGRAAGVRADGAALHADLVLVATGRAGRLGHGLRAVGETRDCGLAYVSRQYRLRPGARPGPTTMPLGAIAQHDGYQVIVFLHENGVFSTLIARPSDDPRLLGLRHEAAFTAAAAAIPLLSAWTGPEQAEPITPVLPGGRLYNTYRGQFDDDGRVPLPGLVFVGDSVCTTNPTAGRGVSTSLMQVARLLALVDEHGDDHAATARAFDAWCAERIRPWFDDHVAVDASQRDRWAGQDVDPTRPPTSDLVMAATAVDPSLWEVVGPYAGMEALPDTLVAAHPRVQEIYASGWRPAFADGPTRDELAELVAGATSGAAATAFA